MPNRLGAVAAAMMIVGCATALSTQPAAPAVDASRVHDLLVLIESADQTAALEAATELARIGPPVAPALIQTLKTHPGCQAQWVASGVLARLKLEAALVETTLVEMARGACRVSSTADLNLQQDAAFVIIDRPRGIALMTELLRDGEPLARRRAAFALDELTERLQPQHPRAIAATPEILAATESALRPLRDAAVSKAHEQIRCMAFEAIDQARSLPYEAVRARATSLLADARVDCGSAGTTAHGSVPASPMRKESWEQIITRLDTQPPGLAAQTSSALLAAGNDVVPLLQKRLRQTDRCQGLALVAGILAARNVAAADVEAAFGRVVAGKCEGRDAFDVTLAQGAANAFVVRPDGIARLVGHLSDRDVAVRRRAAGALGVLFERLGMGAKAQPTSDPAILGAARSAIAPLVTMATTERDQDARCQAVLAVQDAQAAQDETIRTEAEAQSRGRTLRCLAPPNP
jgi:hypothetical protein